MFFLRKLWQYTVKLSICLFFCIVCHAEAGLFSWLFPSKSVEQAIFKLEFFPDGNPSDIKQGTGFVVKIQDDFYLVTNFHIVEEIIETEDINLQIENKNGKVLEIEDIARLSFLHDLALIKIKKGYKGPVLKLTGKTGQNKKAHIMGFKEGQFTKVTLVEVEESHPIYSLGLKDPSDYKVGHLFGASGSPVFNDKEEVIGVKVGGTGQDETFVKSHLIQTALAVKRGHPHKDPKQWVQNEHDSVLAMAQRGNSLAELTMAEYMILKRDKGEITAKQCFRLASTAYRRAAIKGDLIAQKALGMLYLTGNKNKHGFPQDFKKAEKWLRLAVKQSKRINITHLTLIHILLTTKYRSDKKAQEGIELLLELAKQENIRPILEHNENLGQFLETFEKLEEISDEEFDQFQKKLNKIDLKGIAQFYEKLEKLSNEEFEQFLEKWERIDDEDTRQFLEKLKKVTDKDGSEDRRQFLERLKKIIYKNSCEDSMR